MQNNANVKRANELCAKGEALDAEGKFELAIKCYDEAIFLNPNHPYALLFKAKSLGKFGRFGESIECFNEVLSIYPGSDVCLFNKGLILEKAGKDVEALSCYAQALKINPRSDAWWLQKALLEEKLDRRSDAIVSYQQFIENASPNMVTEVQSTKNKLEKLGKPYKETQAIYQREGDKLSKKERERLLSIGSPQYWEEKPSKLRQFVENHEFKVFGKSSKNIFWTKEPNLVIEKIEYLSFTLTPGTPIKGRHIDIWINDASYIENDAKRPELVERFRSMALSEKWAPEVIADSISMITQGVHYVSYGSSRVGLEIGQNGKDRSFCKVYVRCTHK